MILTADLLAIIKQISSDDNQSRQPFSYMTGTVTQEKPLEITLDTTMQPIQSQLLILTEPVVEKKIPILDHNHWIDTLSHTHTCPTGVTSAALTGRYRTEPYSLVSENFDSTEQAQNIICYEHGEPLPIEDGFIILNRRLEVDDRVLLLQAGGGQKFIVLSRIFLPKEE